MKPMIMKLFTPPPRYILNCNNLLRFAAVLGAAALAFAALRRRK